MMIANTVAQYPPAVSVTFTPGSSADRGMVLPAIVAIAIASAGNPTVTQVHPAKSVDGTLQSLPRVVNVGEVWRLVVDCSNRTYARWVTSKPYSG